MWLYKLEFLKEGHHSAEFGGYEYCVSSDVMFILIVGHDSLCSRLGLPLMLVAKAHGMKAHSMLH